MCKPQLKAQNTTIIARVFSSGSNTDRIAGSFPRLQYHADIPSICSEQSSSIAGLSCHIVEAHIYFVANRKVHRGHRLTALIGGYQFVCSGNVPDNSSVLKSRGGEMGRERVVGVVDVG